LKSSVFRCGEIVKGVDEEHCFKLEAMEIVRREGEEALLKSSVLSLK